MSAKGVGLLCKPAGRGNIAASSRLIGSRRYFTTTAAVKDWRVLRKGGTRTDFSMQQRSLMILNPSGCHIRLREEPEALYIPREDKVAQLRYILRGLELAKDPNSKPESQPVTEAVADHASAEEAVSQSVVKEPVVVGEVILESVAVEQAVVEPAVVEVVSSGPLETLPNLEESTILENRGEQLCKVSGEPTGAHTIVQSGNGRFTMKITRAYEQDSSSSSGSSTETSSSESFSSDEEDQEGPSSPGGLGKTKLDEIVVPEIPPTEEGAKTSPEILPTQEVAKASPKIPPTKKGNRTSPAILLTQDGTKTSQASLPPQENANTSQASLPTQEGAKTSQASLPTQEGAKTSPKIPPSLKATIASPKLSPEEVAERVSQLRKQYEQKHPRR